MTATIPDWRYRWYLRKWNRATRRDSLLFTACGRYADTLHTDTLAAVTCWNCKATTQARKQREAPGVAAARQMQGGL